jgi:aquaporin Z
MILILKSHWKIYLIEAWALGMFMVSALLFTILLEHPSFPLKSLIAPAIFRRMVIGLAMGTTAVLLIYSPWGKKSGAHMNPAVTLTYLLLKRINKTDAFFYVIAQFIGGLFGVLIVSFFFPNFVRHSSVNFLVTVPGSHGNTSAIIDEFLMSFILIEVILVAGNSKLSRYAGFFAGLLLVVYITLEAPFSGMSINPARTIASAIPANVYTAIWIYFLAPVGGMLSAGYLYKSVYILRKGHCRDMMLHINGRCHENESYLSDK